MRRLAETVTVSCRKFIADWPVGAAIPADNTGSMVWRWRETSADCQELPVLCGSRHDPLRSSVVDSRCLGGSVYRRATTV